MTFLSSNTTEGLIVLKKSTTMDDSQESSFSVSKYETNDDGSMGQFISINECEREIQMLERDIRQQKESSANAKTAITFDQLRKIHTYVPGRPISFPVGLNSSHR